MSRYTAAAIAAVLLFAAGLAGNTALAQSATLTAEQTAQGVVLTITRTGYDHPADGNNVLQIDRCAMVEATSCDDFRSLTNPLVVNRIPTQPLDHPGATFTDEFASPSPPELGATYIYRWIDIAAADTDGDGMDDNIPATAQVTLTIGGGDAADEAILPNVLRGITHGINDGIFNRIQQRQREDGKWQ